MSALRDQILETLKDIERELENSDLYNEGGLEEVDSELTNIRDKLKDFVITDIIFETEGGKKFGVIGTSGHLKRVIMHAIKGACNVKSFQCYKRGKNTMILKSKIHWIGYCDKKNKHCFHETDKRNEPTGNLDEERMYVKFKCCICSEVYEYIMVKHTVKR